MQVMLMRLMSKGEYLIVPKGTKFTGSGKLGLKARNECELQNQLNLCLNKVAKWFDVKKKKKKTHLKC